MSAMSAIVGIHFLVKSFIEVSLSVVMEFINQWFSLSVTTGTHWNSKAEKKAPQHPNIKPLSKLQNHNFQQKRMQDQQLPHES